MQFLGPHSYIPLLVSRSLASIFLVYSCHRTENHIDTQTNEDLIAPSMCKLFVTATPLVIV